MLKGEDLLLAGRSPVGSQGMYRTIGYRAGEDSPSWLTWAQPGHIKKAGYHSWRAPAQQAASLLTQFHSNPHLPNGKAKKKKLLDKKDECRDASMNSINSFQSPSKQEMCPSPTSKHPSSSTSLLRPEAQCLSHKDHESGSTWHPRVYFTTL